MFPALIGAVCKGGLGAITLSGGTGADAATDTDSGSAYHIFDLDGNVYKFEGDGGGKQQIATATDWVRPASKGSLGILQLKWTHLSGDVPTYTLGFSSTADVWTDFDTEHRIGAFATGVLEDGSVTVYIGIGGTVLASAEYAYYAIDTGG